MKITWTSLKGVCLLLLGLATTDGGRSFAADINLTNFSAFAESSSATTAGTAVANPFKDESVGPSAKAVPEPAVPAGVPSCIPGIALCNNDNFDFAGAPGRFWFRGEYLHWWTSGAHLPPLVSTLTDSGSVPETLFGDQTVYNGNHDGYRVDFGMWLDCSHCWGLEADYFDVSGKPCNYDSGPVDGYDASGNPYPVVRLAYDPATYTTSGLALDAVGYPGYCNGRITVETSNYFQSAGVTLRRQLRGYDWSSGSGDVNWKDACVRTFRLDAIGGYRFARLIDTVNEEDDSFVFANNPSNNPNNYLYAYNYANDYRSVNNFNGGELGLNAVYTFGRWSLDVVGKAAIGVNNQYVSLNNLATVDVNNQAGGGRPLVDVVQSFQEFTRNRFSAIPELMVTGGYQLTDHLKVTVGYDLLYWTAVVRAADQIAADPVTGYPYGTTAGSFATGFSWNESHYFAEGLRLGAELRY
jgi:hypothetical protein